MTLVARRPAPAPVARRSTAELVIAQVRAIDAWNRDGRATTAALSSCSSRELRLDAARLSDVRRRQQQALVGWTERQLQDSGTPMPAVAAPRAVIVHRNDWFTSKLATALADGGVRVVATLDNGADAVGITVAEQPDLLLVEDRLPMMTGEQVVRQALTYAPGIVVAAQVGYESEIPALLEAGARSVFPRQVPPADVADALVGLAAT